MTRMISELWLTNLTKPFILQFTLLHTRLESQFQTKCQDTQKNFVPAAVLYGHYRRQKAEHKASRGSL
ncbi:hypothetical protein PRUPE_3G279200 [Prunus persica]|uniref:Uncharacterized protein n=1 Tax=Prunus persica TaxID=3760 RepID=A0A251Q6L1_PRUPE|nr:hypothetical protein PRUPE_3G279200 [Prunus persica]